MTTAGKSHLPQTPHRKPDHSHQREGKSDTGKDGQHRLAEDGGKGDGKELYTVIEKS